MLSRLSDGPSAGASLDCVMSRLDRPLFSGVTETEIDSFWTVRLSRISLADGLLSGSVTRSLATSPDTEDE